MAPTSDVSSGTVTPPPDGKPVEIEAVRAALEADYEIIAELGRGGMAVVYKAREKELDREVAIKVLPAHMAFDADFVERFQREARTAGKLEHPHIVPIYRVGRAGNVIYFVMKLLSGQSLATVLKARKKLTVLETRRILMDVASALGYASKRGVVHRDIKPDNILLDSEGRPVVTDFGIAKTRTGPHTAPGTSMGTKRYMSPEHAQGNKVDGRSDIYSLGVVAYQCLTGNTPFDADDPFAVLYKHINEPIPRPDLQTDDEWALYATIEKMLAKKPEDRFQTSEGLIQALGGEVHTVTLVHGRHSLQQQAFGPTEIIPTPLPWRQRKLAGIPQVAWAGVLGVFLVGTLGYFALGPSEPAAADSVASVGATTKAAAVGTSTQAGTLAAGGTTSVRAGSTTGAKVPATDAKVAATTATKAPVREAFSRCPRPGTRAARELGVPGLMVDSVKPFTQGKDLRVFYDVCGLSAGSPFTVTVRVQRQDVGWRGTKFDVAFPYADVAESARQRRNKTIAMATAPAGRYRLDVSVVDSKGQGQQHSYEFHLVKPQQ